MICSHLFSESALSVALKGDLLVVLAGGSESGVCAVECGVVDAMSFACVGCVSF